MTRLTTTLVFLLLSIVAIGQVGQPTGLLPSNSQSIDQSEVDEAKSNALKSNNGFSRATQTFSIDYFAGDEFVANNNSGTSWEGPFVTRLHSGLPDDTLFQGDLNWAAVTYDSLYNFNNGSPQGYPYSGSQVTVDSLTVVASHVNNTGNEDTIVINLYDYQGQDPDGIQVSNSEIQNNIITTDTLTTSQSLTGDPTQAIGITVAPDTQLATGQKFTAGVKFHGDTSNEFYVVNGYRDACGGQCVAAQSAFPENSFAKQIFWQQGQSFTGVFKEQGIFFDCDQNGQITQGGCEYLFLQNINIIPTVTVDIPFSVSLSADKSTVCPGESVQLSASVVGGSDNYTYQWSPGGSTPSNASTTVQIGSQLGQTTKTYNLQVIDNNTQDTLNQSIDVEVRGVNLSINPSDTTISCGDSIDLFASATGYTQGVQFDWSDGTSGASNTGVKDGQYGLTVQNDEGCSATSTTNVSIAGVNQQLSFDVPDTICVGANVQFTNTSTYTSGWNFTWVVEGTEIGGQDLSYSFSNAGQDTVVLKGDSSGCKISPVQNVFNVYDSTSSFCITGGVAQQSFDRQLEVYPNPASDNLRISLPSTQTDQKVTLDIINIQGKSVYSEVIDSGEGATEKSINLSDLADGIYVVKLQQGTEVATEKVSLNK